jgi:hypothetical protein
MFKDLVNKMNLGAPFSFPRRSILPPHRPVIIINQAATQRTHISFTVRLITKQHRKTGYPDTEGSGISEILPSLIGIV